MSTIDLTDRLFRRLYRSTPITRWDYELGCWIDDSPALTARVSAIAVQKLKEWRHVDGD